MLRGYRESRYVKLQNQTIGETVMCRCNGETKRTVIQETCSCQGEDCANSVSGGAIVGGIIGALVAGPAGALLGAGLGSVAGAAACDDGKK